ncbi:conserved hypothetical protein [Neospora caninum Liverpool]|uniref:Uncharacterized protein n=1 Tax=Neospora caninum (strain Liverpool) TaxID=572307 RepID=F0VCR3_NEOCL|nr:conserved hypothetical protein [Neospora caninum Liverpool]CBZ51428.1 conserved hypothetical protein [Neospora caninum Liverpool]CEL65376.1 TPA: hypothetical protein BN1204_012260 [Neospora caninum Liverpool]|eukprot:XP_003881461.1 conserved hypothetical protein [Neospora caninum Liverpool]
MDLGRSRESPARSLRPEVLGIDCGGHRNGCKHEDRIQRAGTEVAREILCAHPRRESLSESPVLSSALRSPVFFLAASFSSSARSAPLSPSTDSATLSRSRLTPLLPSLSSPLSPSAPPCSEPSFSEPSCSELSPSAYLSEAPRASSGASLCVGKGVSFSSANSRSLRSANRTSHQPPSQRRLLADSDRPSPRDSTGARGTVPETARRASPAVPSGGDFSPPQVRASQDRCPQETHKLTGDLGDAIREIYRLRASIFARASCAVRHRSGRLSQREAIFGCLLHRAQAVTSLLLRLRSELLEARDLHLAARHASSASSSSSPSSSVSGGPGHYSSLCSREATAPSSPSFSSSSPSSSSFSSSSPSSSSFSSSSPFLQSLPSQDGEAAGQCVTEAAGKGCLLTARQLWSYLGRVGSILTTLGKSLPLPPSVDLGRPRVSPAEFEGDLQRLLSSIAHVLPTQEGARDRSRWTEESRETAGDPVETETPSEPVSVSSLRKRSPGHDGPSPHRGEGETGWSDSAVERVPLSAWPLARDLHGLLHAYALAVTAALSTAASLPILDAADEWIVATLHSTAWCVRLFPCFPPVSSVPSAAPFASPAAWAGAVAARSSLPSFMASSSLSSAVQAFASTAQGSLPPLVSAAQARMPRLREAALMDLAWSVTSLKDLLCPSGGTELARDSPSGLPLSLDEDTYGAWESDRFPDQQETAPIAPSSRQLAAPSTPAASPGPAFSPDAFMDAIAERTAEIPEGGSRAWPVALLRAACIFSSFPPLLFARFSRMILNLDPGTPSRGVRSGASPPREGPPSPSFPSPAPASSSSPSGASSFSPSAASAAPSLASGASPAEKERFLAAASPAALSALLWAYARFLTASSCARRDASSPSASLPTDSAQFHRAAFYAVLAHALQSLRRQPGWPAEACGFSPLLPASRFHRRSRDQERGTSEKGERPKTPGKAAWETRSICTGCWAASRVLEVTPGSEQENRHLTLAFLKETLHFCLPAFVGPGTAPQAGDPVPDPSAAGLPFSLLGGSFLDVMNLLEASYRCRYISLPLLNFVVAGLTRKEATSRQVPDRTDPPRRTFPGIADDTRAWPAKQAGVSTSREISAAVALFVMLARHSTFAVEQRVDSLVRRRASHAARSGDAAVSATATGRESASFSRGASQDVSREDRGAASLRRRGTGTGGEETSLGAGDPNPAAVSASASACVGASWEGQQAAPEGAFDDAATAERALAKLAEGRGVLVRMVLRQFNEVRDSEICNLVWALVNSLRDAATEPCFAPLGGSGAQTPAFDREEERDARAAHAGAETPRDRGSSPSGSRPGRVGPRTAKTNEGELLERILARMRVPDFECPPAHISRLAWTLTRPELLETAEHAGIPQEVVSQLLDKVLARVLASANAEAPRKARGQLRWPVQESGAVSRPQETLDEPRQPGPLLSRLGVERLCSILVSYPSFKHANEDVKSRFVSTAIDELCDLFCMQASQAALATPALSRLIDEALKMETLAGVVWALNVLNRRHTLLVALVTDHVTARLLQHSEGHWGGAAVERRREDLDSIGEPDSARQRAKGGGERRARVAEASWSPMGTRQLSPGRGGAETPCFLSAEPASAALSNSTALVRFPRLLMTYLTACSKLRCDLPPSFFEACSRYVASLASFVEELAVNGDRTRRHSPVVSARPGGSPRPAEGTRGSAGREETTVRTLTRNPLSREDACTALKAQEIMAKEGWPLWTCANLLSACTACGCTDRRFLQPLTRLLSLALLGKVCLCTEGQDRQCGGETRNTQCRDTEETRPPAASLGVGASALHPLLASSVSPPLPVASKSATGEKEGAPSPPLDALPSNAGGALLPVVLASIVPDVQRSVALLLAAFSRAGFTAGNPLYPVLLASAAALTRKELVAAKLCDEGAETEKRDIRSVLLELAEGQSLDAPANCLSASWNTSVYTSFLDFVFQNFTSPQRSSQTPSLSPAAPAGLCSSPFLLASAPSRLPAHTSESPQLERGPSALFPPGSASTAPIASSLAAVETACVAVAASLGISPSVLEVWRFLGPLSTMPIQSTLQRRARWALQAVLDPYQVEIFEELLLPPPLSAFVDLLLVHKASQRALAVEVDGPSHFLSWLQRDPPPAGTGAARENERMAEHRREDARGKGDAAEQRSSITCLASGPPSYQAHMRMSDLVDRETGATLTGRLEEFPTPEWTAEEVYCAGDCDVVVPVRYICDGKTRQKRLRLERAGVACLHLPFFRFPPWQTSASLAAFLRSTLPRNWLRAGQQPLARFKEPDWEDPAAYAAGTVKCVELLARGASEEEAAAFRRTSGGKHVRSEGEEKPRFAQDGETPRAAEHVEAADREMEETRFQGLERKQRGRETHSSPSLFQTAHGSALSHRPRDARTPEGLENAPRARLLSSTARQRTGSEASRQDARETPVSSRASGCMPSPSRPRWLWGEETREREAQTAGAPEGDKSGSGPRLRYIEDSEEDGDAEGATEPREGHHLCGLTSEQQAFLLKQAVRSFVSPLEEKRAKLASPATEVSRADSGTASLSSLSENGSPPPESASVALPAGPEESVDASVLQRALCLQKKLEACVSRPQRLPIHLQWLHALATERQFHLERLGYPQPQLRLCMHRGKDERKGVFHERAGEPTTNRPRAGQSEGTRDPASAGGRDESPLRVADSPGSGPACGGDERGGSRPARDAPSPASAPSWSLSPSYLLLTHQPMIYAVLSLTDPRLWLLAACPPNQAPAFHFLHLVDSASVRASSRRAGAVSHEGKQTKLPRQGGKNAKRSFGGASHFVSDGRLAGVLVGQTLHAGRFGHRRVAEVLAGWATGKLESAAQNVLLYPLEVLPCHHPRAPFKAIADDRLRVWLQLLTPVQCGEGYGARTEDFSLAAKDERAKEEDLSSRERSLRARLLLPPPRQPQAWDAEETEGRISPSLETERAPA